MIMSPRTSLTLGLLGLWQPPGPLPLQAELENPHKRTISAVGLPSVLQTASCRWNGQGPLPTLSMLGPSASPFQILNTTPKYPRKGRSHNRETQFNLSLQTYLFVSCIFNTCVLVGLACFKTDPTSKKCLLQALRRKLKTKGGKSQQLMAAEFEHAQTKNRVSD